MQKPFTVWIPENCGKFLEMRILDHLITCLLRDYADQEAIVRTGHGTMDWFKIGKGVRQGCILSLGLFNICAEYIMWNAGLEEAQAGIKIAGRNINSLRYADDTTLMSESEEEWKSLLMKVKEESEKAGLKLSIQETRIMASGPITSWQRNGVKVETVTDYFLGLPSYWGWWLQPWNEKTLAPWKESYDKPIQHIWRRKWQPTPVFLPGESQGRQSLVGCRLWGRTELHTTEVT